MATDYYFVGQSVASSGGSFLNPMLGPNGTAGAPTYSFAGDSDSGWYLAAANTPAVSAGGTQVVNWSSSGSTLAAGSSYIWSGRSKLSSSADGIVTMTDNAGTAFTRLTFGGTSSSYPALKRNGTALNLRLADDSADAALTLAGATFSGALTLPAGAAATPTLAFATAGLYLPAANTLGLSVAGADFCWLDASGSYVTFRAKTGGGSSNGFQYLAGNGNLVLVVDDGNGIVGRNKGFSASNNSVIGAQKGDIIWTGVQSTHTEYCQQTSISASATLSGATTTIGSNLLPAGSVIRGVVARVTTAVTGATSFEIGDGTDVDRFGTAVAVALNTTTTTANWTITSLPVYPTAANIVLTANGSNFTGGVVRVTVLYDTFGAPAS